MSNLIYIKVQSQFILHGVNLYNKFGYMCKKIYEINKI